ncbi:hypothetical protein HL670_00571 [Serratia plymuthica]|uniref:beta strand repeat-containing protein n=1 Tax=Serratia plymuthica TaxID=82996 RepID=UPI00148DBBE4|nr:DUF4214 domain-containing protein [Serratia plymuthica]QJW53714.1 hypothetical protein HL670_00571 [Serratia plymuthica]
MASLYYQQEAAALYYAVLGKNASQSTYDFFGQSLETGASTAEQLVNTFLAGNDGQARFATKTPAEVLTQIYTNVYGSAPSSTELTALLNAGTTASAIAQLVDSTLHYSGFDANSLAGQTHLETTINTVLYPVSATAAVAGASTVEAIYYVIGGAAAQSGINYWGAKVAGGTSVSDVAQVFVNDRVYLTSLNNTDFVARLFENAFLRAPTAAESSTYVSLLDGGTTRGTVVVDVINLIKGTVASGDLAAQQNFTQATQVYSPGQLPGLSYQEQVASIYLAVPGRGVDSQALDTWSKQLSSGTTFTKLLTSLISTSEFQAKGGALSGSAFVTKVFTDVWGSAPTAQQLATYTALGSNTAIAQAIINDLRTSTATDNTTVSAQHGFEDAIGTSLLYKTAATLSTSAASGNATGTVNTGSSHVLSNAETAVLQNVILNATAATTANLQFADHLANLTINGTAASTVNLSTDGVNPGVAVTVNDANVILNASSGADKVTVTSAATVNTGTGDFNLGAGNDSLKWAGNAAVNGANTVGAGISGNGGAGTDVLSANFITKNVNVGNLFSATTIVSNAAQFTNFEKLDLAGYIGKATVSSGSTAANHTFDFGVLTGNASTETSALTGIVNQAATSTTGSQGFVLSGLAEAVKVINVAGGTVAQLEVTGNATAASSVAFTFLQDATNKFDIAFTAASDTDVNAGSVSLASSSSALFGTALSTVNVASGGAGDFGNILSLTGTNTQVTTLNVTGDHTLDLTVGSGYSNVRTIDASANTAGVDIDAQVSGTGSGFIAQFINLFPFGPIFTTLFGLNGSNVNITGTAADDTFTVRDNTAIKGNGGNDKFEIVSSGSQSSVSISDYNYAKNSILDVKSNLLVSDTDAGTQVADYGSKTGQGLVDALSLFTGTAFSGFVGALFGLNNNVLSAKVGVSSVDNTHFLMIDENNNHLLDSSDTVVALVGGTHADLVSNLHYS